MCLLNNSLAVVSKFVLPFGAGIGFAIMAFFFGIFFLATEAGSLTDLDIDGSVHTHVSQTCSTYANKYNIHTELNYYTVMY